MDTIGDTTSDRLLQYIIHYFTEHKIMPSLREMSRDCGIKSTSNVSFCLNQLERRGDIRRMPNVARAIILQNYDLELKRKNATSPNLAETGRLAGEDAGIAYYFYGLPEGE